MKKTALLSLKFLGVFSLICGVVYPLTVWLFGNVVFNHKATGSLIYDKQGNIIASELIAQNFYKDHYFHPRPSYAGKEGYDASKSSGSNLAPTSKTLIEAIASRSQDYRTLNRLSDNQLVPVDAVTASASGLDPDISLENALLQASRIADARKVDQNEVVKLIQAHAKGRFLGIFGTSRINTVVLNIELDQKYPL